MQFIYVISAVAAFLGLGFFFTLITLGYPWSNTIFCVVSIIVFNVPTNLETSLNLSRKLFHKFSSMDYINYPESIEMLGDFSTLLLPKTGIITQNRMTVVRTWFNNKTVDIDLFEDEPSAEIKDEVEWKALERAACLCNRAVFKEEDRRDTEYGTSTEGAILKCAEITKGDVIDFRTKNSKVYQVTNAQEHNIQITIHQLEDPTEEGYLMVMMGAPEEILKRCWTIYCEGLEKPLGEETKKSIEDTVEKFAKMGERVIAFCDLKL